MANNDVNNIENNDDETCDNTYNDIDNNDINAKCLLLYGLQREHRHYDLCGKYLYWKDLNNKPAYILDEETTKGKAVLYSRKNGDYKGYWMISAYPHSYNRETGWIQTTKKQKNPWDVSYSIWDGNSSYGSFIKNSLLKCECIETYMPKNSIVESTNRMFENSIFSDVTFILPDGGRIDGHKCLVATRSEYFKALFTHGKFVDSKEIIIEEDVTTDIWKILMIYMYTNQIPPINIKLRLELLKLANQYCMQDLKNRCEKMCIKNITLTNIIPWLITSYRYDVPLIKNKFL